KEKPIDKPAANPEVASAETDLSNSASPSRRTASWTTCALTDVRCSASSCSRSVNCGATIGSSGCNSGVAAFSTTLRRQSNARNFHTGIAVPGNLMRRGRRATLRRSLHQKHEWHQTEQRHSRYRDDVHVCQQSRLACHSAADQRVSPCRRFVGRNPLCDESLGDPIDSLHERGIARSRVGAQIYLVLLREPL